MDERWGHTKPVPEDRITLVEEGDTVEGFEVAYTPGHASHHVSYFDPDSGWVFAGDVAGVRVAEAAHTLMPTPPPDIQVEQWHESLDKLAAWSPKGIGVAHFGGHEDVAQVLQDAREQLDKWAEKAREIADHDAFTEAFEADLKSQRPGRRDPAVDAPGLRAPPRIPGPRAVLAQARRRLSHAGAHDRRGRRLRGRPDGAGGGAGRLRAWPGRSCSSAWPSGRSSPGCVRGADPEAGYDRRLERRFTPLLQPPRPTRLPRRLEPRRRQPRGAQRGRPPASRAELGLDSCGSRRSSGDDVRAARRGGVDARVDGGRVARRARLPRRRRARPRRSKRAPTSIITGRVADAALFCRAAHALETSRTRCGRSTVGHLLECAAPGQRAATSSRPAAAGSRADELARIGYPLATLAATASAELFVLDGAPARLDALTCTLQLLYEVHDPPPTSRPTAILDFTGVRFEEIGTQSRARERRAQHAAGPSG